MKALEFILEKRNTENYEVFNLGSGSGVSVLEMIHAFEEITGVKLNYVLGKRRDGDVPAIYSDSTRAEHLLHWHCKYGLNDMVKTAWRWEENLS